MGKNKNAMEQVLAKIALLHLFFQLAMRRHHHAHVHLGRLVSANAFDFSLFQHAQQFGLHGQRHVADFVEKQRAVRGLLKLANVS